MKKNLLLSLLLLVCSLHTLFAYDFTIEGTITMGDGSPAAQAEVNFFAENANIFQQAFADENGFYSVTFQIPDGTAMNITGEVLDWCNGDLVTVTVTSMSGTSTVNFIICSDGGGNACEAHFDYEHAPVNALGVQFHDLSITPEPATSWFWDFGDGGVSDEQNPIHFFNEIGQYMVTLTVHSPSCTAVTHQYIWVDENTGGNDCEAWFYYTQGNSNNFLEISFFSIAQTDDVQNWSWDFGDGGTSNEANPVHTYAAEGTYTVVLTVSTANGCTSTFQETLVLQAPPECEAWFYYVQDNANDLLSVQFFDHSLGDITAWSWDFGDGNSSNEQNPVHTYASGGDYDVTLTVSTANGCTSTFIDHVHIWTPPTCEAWFSFHLVDPNNALTIQFEDNSFGNVDSWHWDFGDGHSSTEQNPIHTYASEGGYFVTLTIVSGDCSSTISHIVEVGNGCVCTQEYDPVCVHTPNGGIFTYPNACTAMCDGWTSDDFVNCGDNVPCQASFHHVPADNIGLTIHFHDESMGNVTQWSWSFGDGTGSSEQNPIHTFGAEGFYIVTLTITTQNNCTNSISQEIAVGNVWDYPEECQAMFWFGLDANAPLTVEFEDLSIGDNISSWHWDFGDGHSSTEQHPSHTYANEGIYLVNLTIVSGDCTSSIDMLVWTSDDIVYNDQCQALFLPSINGLEVSFFDLSSGAVVDWHWDFGDGNSSTEPLPIHIYEGPGVYMVTLTITTAEGCSSIYETTIDLNDADFQGNAAASAFSTALSMEWLDFTATQKDESILLNWQTANEKDNAYFIVQKSLDGIYFEKMGRVEAKNNESVQNYNFMDDAPVAGYNYYRLQQVGIDGKSSNSKIALLYFEKSDVSEVQVFPNPLSDILNWTSDDNTSFLQGELWDVNGILVKTFNPIDGRLNIANLPMGTYFLKLIGKERVTLKKVVRQ